MYVNAFVFNESILVSSDYTLKWKKGILLFSYLLFILLFYMEVFVCLLETKMQFKKGIFCIYVARFSC